MNLRHRFPKLMFSVAGIAVFLLDAPLAARANPDRQKLAESAIDQVQKRFYEKQDFKPVWEEFYVRDAKLRSIEVEAIMSQYVDHAKPPIGHEHKERAYVALWTFWHLMSAFSFTNDSKSDQERAFIELKDPYESMTQYGKPFSNERDLQEHMIRPLDHLAALLHKYVIPNQFNSDTYKQRVAEWAQRINEDPQRVRHADPDRIREIFIPAGLPKDTVVYVVPREMFHYYLIEEEKQMRLLTVLLRVRD